MLPALDRLRDYRREWLAPDLLAGTSAGAVVIPQAMAYATVASLPVEAGLYTCIFPMVVYALIGGARRMSVSTTSTIVALTGAALLSADVGSDPDALLDATATLTLLVGLVLVVARLLRIGFLVESVSEVVVVGLKVGVGLTIACSQLPDLLGIAPAEDDGFVPNLANTVRHLGETDGRTATLAAVTITGLLVVRRCARRVPGPLLAVVGGIVAVGVFDLDVAVIPEVPRGLPTPAVPSFDHAAALTPFAVAIGLMAYLESVSVARATRKRDDPPLDNDHELLAVGAAAMAGSVFQCLPPAGGFSQTMVNVEAGARSQVSGLVTATLALLTALLLAPILGDLPHATLAAIVFVAVMGLVDLTDLRRLARVDRAEFVLAVLVGAVALLTNLLVGVAVGVLLTYYLVLRALNHPVIVELRPGRDGELQPARAGDPDVPGLLVLRIEGGLYTANVRVAQASLYERVAAHRPKPDVLVVDVAGTADTSVTVMDVFAETDDQLRRDGVELWIAALPTRALAKARRTDAWAQWVDGGRVHATVHAALDAFARRGAPRAAPPSGAPPPTGEAVRPA